MVRVCPKFAWETNIMSILVNQYFVFLCYCNSIIVLVFSYFNMMKKNNNQKIHLPILIEQDEDDFYIVSCPIFKGCHSFGKTIDEALDNIREVIDICIEEEGENGLTGINRFVGFREIEVFVGASAH